MKGRFATGVSLAGAGFAGTLMLNPIGFGLVIAGAKIGSDARVIENKLISRELHTQTLSPGGSAEGFVYFDVAATRSCPTCVLVVELLDPSTESMTSLKVSIPWKR